jgi:hypothetical protein
MRQLSLNGDARLPGSPPVSFETQTSKDLPSSTQSTKQHNIISFLSPSGWYTPDFLFDNEYTSALPIRRKHIYNTQQNGVESWLAFIFRPILHGFSCVCAMGHYNTGVCSTAGSLENVSTSISTAAESSSFSAQVAITLAQTRITSPSY